VAGVPDPVQMELVYAFVVLKDPARANQDTETKLIEHRRTQLIKWSCPREIDFRAELPKTRVGKIDYKLLVLEHAARHASQGAGR
jgi:acyl-coenzyme A synthetase/AMP-(fatty) acid ligase